MAYGEVLNELNTSIIKKPYYDTEQFEKAVFLLGESQEMLGDNESWQYDMQDLLRQVLNNRGTEAALSAVEAWKVKDYKEFEEKTALFFRLFDACERLMYIRQDTTLADWLGYAEQAGKPYGGETSKLFAEDAKRLITTWGEEETYGSLADYAYRQYGGLLKYYYRPRWEVFFGRMESISVKEWYQMAQEFLKTDCGMEAELLGGEGVIYDTLQLLRENCKTV